MTRDRGVRVIAIVALCVAVLGLGIGYSSLQTILKINTTAKIKAASWKVQFKDTTYDENVSNVLGATVTAKEESEPQYSATVMSIDVSLKTPGDKIYYDFIIENKGDLDAKVEAAPTLSGLTNEQKEYINYTLTYSNGDEISKDDELKVDEEKSVRLTVEFDKDYESTFEEDQELNLVATIPYVQK